MSKKPSSTGKTRHIWSKGSMTEAEYQKWQDSRDPYEAFLFPCTGSITKNVAITAANIAVGAVFCRFMKFIKEIS